MLIVADDDAESPIDSPSAPWTDLAQNRDLVVQSQSAERLQLRRRLHPLSG
jgi:hypothetical protein